MITYLLILACAFPVLLLFLFSIFATTAPVGLRIALAAAGVVTGCYALTKWSRLSSTTGSGRWGYGPLFLPIPTAIIAAYLAIAGTIAAGMARCLSARSLGGSILTGLLLIGWLAVGIFFMHTFHSVL